MNFDLLYSCIKQVPRATSSSAAGNIHWHVQRKKNGANAAFAHPWNIDAAFNVTRRQIKLIEEQSLWSIHMRVEHQAGEMDLAGERGNVFRAHEGMAR